VDILTKHISYFDSEQNSKFKATVDGLMQD